MAHRDALASEHGLGFQFVQLWRVFAAVVAAGIYGSAQIQGCDGGAPEEAAPNFNLLRLNAYCHEEICGSVLLGWYLVDTESGRVWEWDMAEDARGAEITPTM